MSDPDSAFDSIPLPASEPLTNSISAIEKGQNASKYKRWFILVAVGLLGIALIGGLIGFSYLDRYRIAADKLDLDQISRIERGCLVEDRQGRSLGRIFVQDRLFVTFEQLPESLIKAIVATEDNRFFEHKGYDLRGMMRAALVNFRRGEIRQGGSTITQQLARHGLGLQGRTFERKFIEIFAAARIEDAYSKEEILEQYFNRIYFGEGLYGIGSAANTYFGKTVSDLNEAESAALCALIKSPENLNPHDHPEAALRARNITLQRMEKLGFFSSQHAEELMASPLGEIPKAEVRNRPHYLLAQIREEVNELLGSTRHNHDNLVVETSVSSTIQYQGEQLLNQQLVEIENSEPYPHAKKAELESGNTNYLQGAVLVIENQTGAIVASVGGRDFSESQFNRATNARRRPGTLFLPFTYAAAYQSGKIRPQSLILDSPLDNRKVMIGGTEGVLGEWAAESVSNQYEGEIPAFRALAIGKNAASVRAGSVVGLASVAEVARRVGIDSELREFPATMLGESAMTPLELARAYSVFPNGGSAMPKPSLVLAIRDDEGDELFRKTDSAVETTALLPLTAGQVVASLAHRSGTRKLVFRTGNSYGFEDAWAVGFNAEYTFLVWIGFDDGREIHPNAFGRNLALPCLNQLFELSPTEQLIPIPLGTLEKSLCWDTGKLAGEHCSHTLSIPFEPSESSHLEQCPDHDLSGDLLFSNPGTTQSLPLGEVIPIRGALVLGTNPFAKSDASK